MGALYMITVHHGIEISARGTVCEHLSKVVSGTGIMSDTSVEMSESD